MNLTGHVFGHLSCGIGDREIQRLMDWKRKQNYYQAGISGIVKESRVDIEHRLNGLSRY